jgi:hypothetical protein
MGFYIRKAFNFGPFRLNLSKKGIGTSIGVKGLRVSTGPRGNELYAGRYGLYYRQKLKNGAERTDTDLPPVQTIPTEGDVPPIQSMATGDDIPPVQVTRGSGIGLALTIVAVVVLLFVVAVYFLG